ncbi:MAG: glycosyltransferase family 4 protein [Verrucomicrobiales bacterium]
MRILQVLPELNSGGVERGTAELARYLVENGHESLVLSNGGRLVATLEEQGSRHISLPVHKKSLFSLRHIPRLVRLLREEKPDILHLRSRAPAWLCYLAWKRLPKEERPRLVTTVHGLNSVNVYSAIMTAGERVICVSEAVKGYVTRNYPKVDVAKLTVIHRGIDPASYQSDFRPVDSWVDQWNKDFPETKGKKLLTLPGRITRLKGHEDFFQILRLVPDDHHGVIAGGAHPRKVAYLDELKNKAREMKLENRITFTGHRSDLREILAHSELVFSLSQTPEAFGRTTLEALSLGTPVVGYDDGGVAEILKTCFPQGATPFKDPGAASELTLQLLESSPVIDAPGPFILENCLAQTVRVYRELLR